MKKSSRNIIAVLGALSILALSPGATMAERERIVCPSPIPSVTLTRPGAAGGTSATPDGADFKPGTQLKGMKYNQTANNLVFRDTVRFRKPSAKMLCCQFSQVAYKPTRTSPGPFYGTLTVTYRALQNGASARSNDAGSDSGGLLYRDSLVPGQSGLIYSRFPFSAGYIQTRTYYLTANIIASGQVSFTVQNHSAVVSATLYVPGGCCVEPTLIQAGKDKG